MGRRRKEKTEPEVLEYGEPVVVESALPGEPLPQGLKAPVAENAEPEFESPCTLGALGSAIPGGIIGYLFGFGGKLVGHKGPGRFAAAKIDGWESAKSFALISASYQLAVCLSSRIREKEDGANHAVGGCATGLAYGYKQGPLAAAQSCLMLGAASYFFQRISPEPAMAAAADALRSRASAAAASARSAIGSRSDAIGSRSDAADAVDLAVRAFLTPAAQGLSAACPAAGTWLACPARRRRATKAMK